MPYFENAIRKMLPKTFRRKHVAHDMYVALAHFQSFVPKMDTYVYNDGTTKKLMSLSGTIPVLYEDATYNIPVCLWIEASYPETAPICYVTPTGDMMVLTGKFIGTNGEILLPYLEDWKTGKCDLVGLLQVMVVTFSDLPPVCMRPHPEPEEALCWLQFHRQAEVVSTTDGSLYLNLAGEDDLPFQQENETNC